MSANLYQLKNDSLASHQPLSIKLMYKITGAKAGSFLAMVPQVVKGYDTGDFTQAAIDALLGSSSEFVAATAFGATAMGVDAMGIVLMLDGQLLQSADCVLKISGTIGTTGVSDVVLAQTSALPDTLAAPARMQISSAGNVAIQYVKTGLDAATSGVLVFDLLVRPK